MAILFPEDQDAQPVQPEQSPSWGDYGNVALAGAKKLAGGVDAAARYLAELRGDTETAAMRGAEERIVNRSAESTTDELSDVARQRWQMAVTDPKFWEHPFSASALKATGMAPMLVAAALPGGLAADVMSATAGAALTGGAINAAQGLDDFYAKLDQYDDKTLQDESELYRGLRSMYDETQARREYNLTVQGLKPAINFLVGAAASAVGPSAAIARKLTGGSAVAGAEGGRIASGTIGALEGGGGGLVQSGVGDVTLQSALMEGGVQKEFDPHQFAAAIAEGGGMGALAGGAAGGILGGHGAKTKQETPSPPPKGYGTGNNPAPRTDVDVGNEQSAPTRSAKEYPKEGVEGAKVAPVEASKPDADQSAAIANSAATNQKAPPPEEVLAAAQRVAQAQPPAPEPTPAAPQQPTMPPAVAEAVQRVRKGKAKEEPKAEVTPEVTKPEPVAEAVAPPVEAAPVPEAPKGPRVLESLTPESQAAKAASKEAYKQANNNARDVLKAENPTEEAPAKSHKSKGVQGAAAEHEKNAQQIVENRAPVAGETDEAVLQRAQGMVDEAELAGVKIPKRLKGEKSAAITTLREAADLQRATTTKSWAANKKYRTEALARFRAREAAARAGDTGEALASRRAEGDEIKRVTQGNPEDKAEVTSEVIEGVAPGTGTKRVNVRDSETSERASVRDSRSEERAPSAVRKVELTPEQKAEIEAKFNAKVGPKAAEVKARVEAKPEAKPKPTKVDKIKQRIATLKKEIDGEAKKVDTAPTEAQKAAGNYEKGHINVHGLEVTIENPRGTQRNGVGEGGKPWSVKMPDHYGYIKGTEGADGDHVDTYVGPHPESKDVLVIDQVHPDTKKFDEHKVLLGYKNGAQALDAYERAFSDGRGLDRVGKITPMSIDEFKAWVKDRKATKAPTDDAVTSALKPGGPLFASPEAPQGVRPMYTMKASEALEGLDLTHLNGVPAALGAFFKAKLTRLVGDMPVHILSKEDMAKYRGEPLGSEGTYGLHTIDTKGNDAILLRADKLEDPAQAAHIVLHEAAHGATVRALIEDEHIEGKVKNLMDEVFSFTVKLPQSIQNHMEYAFTNPREFVAEAFSNANVQEILASTPVSDKMAREFGLGGAPRTAWDLVISVVRLAIEKITGKLPKGNTALDAIMRLGSELEELHLDYVDHERVYGPTPVNFRKSAIESPMRGAIDGAKDAIQNLSEHPVDTLVGAVRDIAGRPNATPLLKRIGNALTSNDQLRQRVEGLVPHSRPIFDMIEKQGVLANKLKTDGTRLIADMMRAAKQDPDSFKRFAVLANEQTMHGVDAASKIGEGRNAYLQLSKENREAQAAGKFDPAEANSAHWGAHGAHPRLSAEYKDLIASRPDYAKLQERLFSFFEDAQHDMARGHIEEYLRAAGVAEGDRKAKAEALTSNKLDSDAREQLAKDYGEPIAKQILAAKRMTGSEGPYSPLMRHGDYVVGGKYKVKEPTNAIRKVDDGTWEFKTRQEAHKFAESTGLHYDVGTTYYDPTTGERTTKTGGISQAGNAEKRWEISVERNHVEFHANEREAGVAQKSLHETGELEHEPYLEKKQDYIGRGQEIGAGALDIIDRRLTQTDEYRRATDAQKADMRKSLQEAALVTRAGNRVQSRRLPRRRVQGASDDLVRNLWVYNDSQANYRAKLQYRPQIEEQLQAMHKFVTDSRYDTRSALDPNTLKRSEIANEIDQRARAQDPNEYTGTFTDWARRVTTWSYIDRMLRPSHLILHQTHLPMITAPFIAGRHGAVSTYAEILRTWKQAVRSYKAGGYDFMKSVGDSLHEGTDYQALMKESFKGYPDGQRVGRMFDTLAEIGLIHPQSGIEVAKYQPSRQVGGAIGALDHVINRLDTIFRHATNATEAINRYVGAAAAYRLEFAKLTSKGMSEAKAHDAATEYARNTVANTQGFYSATNAAPLFKNKILRPFLQFKQFPQMMYHLLISTANRALRGASREEKVQAAASLIAVLGAHTLMTGALGGLPLEGFKIAGLVSKGLGITDGDWSDVERWQYEKAVELFGREGADYVMHGVARHAFGVDVHHRLGLNSFFTFGLPSKTDNKSVKAFILDQALGAPEGLVQDTLTGINQMMQGDVVNGAAKALPAQALRDVLRAWHGGPANDKYKYSTGERVARVLGFTPTGEAHQGERAAEMSQLKGEYTTKRNTLIKGWTEGKDKSSAWTEIQKFNAGIPPAARITMAQLQQAKTRKDKAVQSGTNYLGVTFNKQTKFIADRDRALY